MTNIEIIYLENGNISIEIDKNTGNLLYENILEALGDIDIVTCNEINEGEYDMLVDSEENIFFLQSKQFSELKKTGKTELVKHSTLKDNINLDNEYHKKFLTWYYNED